MLDLLGGSLDVGEGEALRVEEPRRAHHGHREHPRGPRGRERLGLGLVELVQHQVDERLDLVRVRVRVRVRVGVRFRVRFGVRVGVGVGARVRLRVTPV